MIDNPIRLKAFDWLSEQTQIYGDVLPRKLLQNGFYYENLRIPLISPQGIFKPKTLKYPLSITTTPLGPYDDSFSPDGFLLYKYRGTNPNHRDNVGLRQALEKKIPMIYFHGIIPGKYLAVWPVYIIFDDPGNLTFKVAVDDISCLEKDLNLVSEDTLHRRAYITSTVRTRLHQRSFRERVLSAYHSQCALCRFRHVELLDAAHIIPDSEPESKPTINNGIALCKLHHAAFDSFIIGISPDYQIQIRIDVLEEEDGSMLQHGLKALHGMNIILPKDSKYWPDQELLEVRFQKFKNAG